MFCYCTGKLKLNEYSSPKYCPVGKILDGMEVKLLDENMNEVGKGEIGELYSTGPCIADGYLNNKELTKKNL